MAADTAAGGAKATTPEARSGWVPPSPSATSSDWIQLDTHEWLKGEIKLIQDDTVSFDSDKLHELSFSWDDIVVLVTAREHTFRFTDDRTILGTGEMRGDIIRIRTGKEVKEFKRSDLVSMIPGAGAERDYWSGKIGIGFAGQAGNTNQLNLSTSIQIARETTYRKASVSYTGSIATQQNAISGNAHRVNAGMSFYVTRRLFIDLPGFEFVHDEFQNIDWRITPSAMVGYDFISKKKVNLRAGGGVGFQAVKYGSVDSGSDRSNDFPLLFKLSFDVDLPKRFEWTNKYGLQLIVTEIGNTNQHLVSTLSFDFWGPLDFNTIFQWDWIASPQATATSAVPKSSDYRITVGFSLNL
jgi:putative salt-induced outer membrane protein YdiY